MSAPKSFRASVQQAANKEKPIDFNITDDHGLPDEPDQFSVYAFQATRPASGQLLLLAATDFDDPDRSRQSMQIVFDFLEAILGSDGRRGMERLLARQIIDEDGIVEVVNWLIEEWGDFPTQPASDSSPTPARTGTRSTGRQRRVESTPSISPSIAS